MLSCKRLSVTYKGPSVDIAPIRDLSFEIATGSLAVMGPSGSGKSTLLRVLAGLQRPNTGSVVLDGDAIAPAGGGLVDRRVSYVRQDYQLVDFLTVAENLKLAIELRNLPLRQRVVPDILESVGLIGFADRMPATLSGGQRQRVAIARALICQARLILADEPTGALDSENTQSLTQLLASIAQDGRAMVIVATHDDRVAHGMDRTARLEAGRLRPAAA